VIGLEMFRIEDSFIYEHKIAELSRTIGDAPKFWKRIDAANSDLAEFDLQVPGFTPKFTVTVFLGHWSFSPNKDWASGADNYNRAFNTFHGSADQLAMAIIDFCALVSGGEHESSIERLHQLLEQRHA
jgi:hypothetical protein